MKPSDARRSFVFEKLVPRILSPAGPKALNVRDEFRDHFVENGLGPVRSEEMANDHFGQLCDSIERHLSDWDAQGVPRPLTQSDQDHIYLVWSHNQFPRYSGLRESIDRNFCEIFQYVQTLDGSQFVVICAIWLKCVGFRKILVCDARGDEGVDLLGLLEHGGLRSLVVVVQAKTSKSLVGRGLVLAEYGKYLMLPHTEKYIEYRRALDLDRRIEGNSWVYMLLSNQPFDAGARRVSSRLGILLRSIHQIAFFLAKKYTKKQVVDEVERLSPPRADPNYNFYNKLLL